MLLNFSIGRYYGLDSIIEVLMILVSFVISYYSNRVYKLVKEKNYRLFSFAFLAIGISFIFKILSNLTILHRVNVQVANFVFVVFHEFEFMETVNFISLILYKSFHLIGFLILFLLVTKTEKKEKIFLFFYLGLITILFSVYFDFVFHLTLIFILASLTFHFFENYTQKRNLNTFLVFIAFSLILTGHFFFIIESINPLFYLAAEIITLIGFLSLLINQIKLKNEKTNKIGSNQRYVRNTKRK